MRTDLFDFVLPEDRIALRPAAPRESARLLVVRPGAAPQFDDRTIRDLPQLLRPGDAVVVNDTKVIPAFLRGRRIGRGDREPAISANLIKRLDGARWRALVRPAKRLEAGDVVRFGGEGRVCFLDQLDATVEDKGEGGEITLAFAFHGAILDQALAERGEVPLPPYIAGRRAADERDRDDYQTIFARQEGSVAAPTAGLHFTETIAQALAARDVAVHKLTLHVGAGTFAPVRAADIAAHRMHAEYLEVSESTCAAINRVSAAGGRVIAVGTTVVRSLETAAAAATGADNPNRIAPYRGTTRIFIKPGYKFRAVDAMVTNFHLPESTLLMLCSAFAGREALLAAYAHAVEARYRFFSYGDAMFLA